MMKLRKSLAVGVALLAVGLLVLVSGGQKEPVAIEVSASPVIPSSSPTPTEIAAAGTVAGREVAVVKRVVDGDTIELSDGRKLRYIGVDTPESVHPSRPVECLAPEATQKNIELVEGQQVELEKDMSETDRLGRLLRYVYVDEVMVNDVLVREGFARSSKYPPDVKYQSRFDAAQASAQQNKWGLWSDVCTSPVPTVAVQDTTKPATIVLPGECVIKGNINSKNEQIYHLPGCGSYDRTEIDSDRGEQYFCNEEEAQAAGWRKAGNC